MLNCLYDETWFPPSSSPVVAIKFHHKKRWRMIQPTILFPTVTSQILWGIIKVVCHCLTLLMLSSFSCNWYSEVYFLWTGRFYLVLTANQQWTYSPMNLSKTVSAVAASCDNEFRKRIIHWMKKVFLFLFFLLSVWQLLAVNFIKFPWVLVFLEEEKQFFLFTFSTRCNF